MLMCHALKPRTPLIRLGFAVARAPGSAYGFLQGAADRPRGGDLVPGGVAPLTGNGAMRVARHVVAADAQRPPPDDTPEQDEFASAHSPLRLLVVA
jgi:hypothetical protein